MQHVAVIGAGITGITTAYSLLNRGFDVTVFDRHRYAAMQTSFANGGQLSASNAEVWTQAGTIMKGIAWMFRKDAPLLVNPAPSWHKYSWMAEFVANIPHYERNTIASARMAIAAREHLFAWAKRENIEFDLEKRGILHIYADRKGFEHATKVNTLLAAGGLHREPLTPDEMRTLEPTLKSDFFGGYYTQCDATGDIHKYTRGLAKACERLGARFYYDAHVSQLQTNRNATTVTFSAGESADVEQLSFDALVVCAGIDSREFAARLGDRVNVYPVKGYSITVELIDELSQQSAPWVSLLDDDAKIVTSRLGRNRFRIAGTAEFNGVNYDIRHNRITPLADWCRKLFPEVSTNHITPWAGLRPMMPNMMPRVGRGTHPRVFYNTGHGHLGWTLSAATADMIGDIVEGALPPDVGSAAIHPRRFKQAG